MPPDQLAGFRVFLSVCSFLFGLCTALHESKGDTTTPQHHQTHAHTAKHGQITAKLICLSPAAQHIISSHHGQADRGPALHCHRLQADQCAWRAARGRQLAVPAAGDRCVETQPLCALSHSPNSSPHTASSFSPNIHHHHLHTQQQAAASHCQGQTPTHGSCTGTCKHTARPPCLWQRCPSLGARSAAACSCRYRTRCFRPWQRM